MTDGKPHEPYEWHEPTEPADPHDPKQSHAGNGTVNHGPDDQSLPGLDSDELALRRMLHDAVQEMEPRDGTLDHLRRAVPARRARKRQALVGMAAAALFIGTAVPAALHVSNSTGSATNTSNAGHASQAQGGAGQGKGPDGGSGTSGGTGGQSAEKGEGGGKKEGEKGDGTGTGSTGATTGADPTATTAVGAPLCTAAQLGAATPTTAAADTVGAVYGSFRVTNVSTTDCTVTSPGTVGTTPQGAADPTKISTLRHVAGDEAASLPDPSLEAPELLLKPGTAYEVKFAWVPSETCPPAGDSSGGSTGEPTPDPTNSTDTSGTTTGTTTGTDSGTSTQLMTEDGTADGSVVVSYTAEPAAPTASATVSGACAGKVYWTGLLAAS
ncbi:hypothetical protein QQY66_26885 [Streptomyces sp. DG2A-72]|uniref:hypothetical protein n=1 Tax=Streptomyces sp. DG2A-72 TaxID=3051386 RepID=UPI00265BBA17|nr:hypothetical protein [Streptomyces sp. DG2A-72]MDO0935117.1 hypothetical protein [Streptomyces sp. DG2A-72]